VEGWGWGKEREAEVDLLWIEETGWRGGDRSSNILIMYPITMYCVVQPVIIYNNLF
jgi:hypothetical protein